MAKLNFYDTDAVKAFVLDILIENAELKSDLDYEKKCSNDWFDRYKKADQQVKDLEANSERLGADAPSDVDTFQRLKYSKPDEWSDLKGLYSYKGRVPEATKADFQTYKKIKATGIYGTVRVPAAKIDTSTLTLDVAHINERRHGVTQEEAVSYIKNAAFSLKRRHWTGETFLNYYSEEGASYVRTSDNVIRTSFKKDEFDKKTKSAMEVLKNGK